MTEFFNRREDKDKRRILRRDATPAEQRLWAELRDGQVHGLKFRRQYSVGCYVIDFYCPSAKLAIELDGGCHASAEAQAYDAARQAYLETFGIRVLRFPNADVHCRLERVLGRITATATGKPEQPSPYEGEGGEPQRAG